MTMTWQDRYGLPAGTGLRAAHRSAYAGMSMKERLDAGSELLFDVGELGAVVRAYEILSDITRDITLPPGTWATVKIYASKGWGEQTGWAYWNEEQARELTEVESTFMANRYRANGWTLDRYEARQVDDARPGMLVRRGLTAREFIDELKLIHR